MMGRNECVSHINLLTAAKEVITLVEKICNDDRVPVEIRVEYADKFNKIVEGKK
ncbi:hypothetical protein [Siminovitchia terrae]|uniref:hypothetical protein n=1 Tax=Siminovitchia terrae TaxID=1914933 RepID=UPI0028B1D1A3|nr:hypothetical protein [Siminovitchia terrae]